MKVAGTDGDYEHHDAIPPAIFALGRAIYGRLADKALRPRCSRMATQNANESLNSTIWNFCRKESFRGPATVSLAVYLAVAIFNHDRAATFPKILMTMGCDVSNFTQQALEGDDRRRLERGEGSKRRASRTRLLMLRALRTVQADFRYLILMLF